MAATPKSGHSRRIDSKRSLNLPVPLPRFQVRLHWHERDDLNVAGKWLRAALANALRGI